jgi:hypothetical protein
VPRFFVPSGTAEVASCGNEAGPAKEATGPIVVDVGEGRGALVLTSAKELWGCEVEIASDEDRSVRTHVYVLTRSVAGGTVHAAVFPSLPAGRYVVFDLRGRPAQSLDVRSGSITTARWQSAASSRRRAAKEEFSPLPNGVHAHA